MINLKDSLVHGAVTHTVGRTAVT